MACTVGTGVARRCRSRASGWLGRIRRTTAAGPVAAAAPTAVRRVPAGRRARRTGCALRWCSPGEGRQRLRRPARIQRRGDGGGEPGPLGGRQPPIGTQRGEERTSRSPAASRPAGSGASRAAAAVSPDGSLHGLGATAAPRDCARCTPSARWLHPVPSSGCNGCTPPGPLSTATPPVATGCGDYPPSARPPAPGSAAAASLLPSPGN
jgi:hypothetical protein